MPILLSTVNDINKHIQKLMYHGQCCNFTYGVDLEFTNCPDSSQVINTIQIAYNSNLDDVLVIFFPMDENYKSELKEQLINQSNSLFGFLMSRRHVKVGVNLIDDVNKIWREFGIKVLNYIDVQTLGISFNIMNKSMDDLGAAFVPGYIPKSKPGGGYMTLDEKKITYAATDAVNSFLIYYHMLGATKEFLAANRASKLDISIDEDVIAFATEYFHRIKKVRFTSFCNHMRSCYSVWCKLLSDDEVPIMGQKLIDVLKERKIIAYKLGFYFKANDDQHNSHGALRHVR